jgi:hypothetical protein
MGGGDRDICVQKLDPDGNRIWGESGLVVISGDYDQWGPLIMTDGAGGFIVVCNSSEGSENDLFCQRIDFNANELWTAGGVEFVWASGNQILSGIVSDGAGGFIAAWIDLRFAGDLNIYAQRVDNTGAWLWNNNGRYLINQADDQGPAVVTTDGAGGLIMACKDNRNGTSDVYAQGVSADGALLWPAASYGIRVSTSAQDEENMKIAPDGSGGAIITWTNTLSKDVYARRLDADGNVLWGPLGVKVNTGEEADGSWVAEDGAGGAYVFWTEYSSIYDNHSLLCQHFDANGAMFWDSSGVLVRGYPLGIGDVIPLADGKGGAIALWEEIPSGVQADIYAQRVGSDGAWGYPEPVIRSVHDVPSDQGGYVNVEWNASQHDASGEIEEYTVWRSLDTPEALMMIDKGALVIDEASLAGQYAPGSSIPDAAGTIDAECPEKYPEIIRIGGQADDPYYWELVGTSLAHQIDAYAKVVPTAFDSSTASDGIQSFQIIAHSGEPGVHWKSAIMTGFSVDDLAPSIPEGLTGRPLYNPPAIELTWDPNTESDLAGYCLYRGDEIDFVPGPSTLIGQTVETRLTDDYPLWYAAFYKLVAVDVHGNVSEYALLGSGQVTGDDSPDLPPAFALYQNHPNPFNPSTMIRFDLPRDTHVTLDIYSVSGELVATLADGMMEAGHWELVWTGTGRDGGPVTSGVYFYRLVTDGFTRTRKMVLLR